LAELSRAEWVLMNACWDTGKSTARQVYEQVRPRRDWEYQTVKTMLDRLVVKGYLRRDKLGPLCLYEPRVTRVRAVGGAVDSFVETVLDNALGPLAVHLARGRKLKAGELEQLKQLLERCEK